MNNRYLEKIASAETEAEILKTKPSAGGSMLTGALAGHLIGAATGSPAMIPMAMGGLMGGAFAKSQWRDKHKAVEYRNPGVASPGRRTALGAILGSVVADKALTKALVNPAGKTARYVAQVAGMAGGGTLGHISGTRAVDKYLARKNQE